MKSELQIFSGNDSGKSLIEENTKLKIENKRLREIFPKILKALGNGSGCVPNVSLEFLEEIPKEVEMVIDELKNGY